MSKERELLRKLFESGMLDRALTTEVGQLLTQPEPEPKQEPVAWAMLNRQQVYERGWRAGYEAGGGE